MAKTEETAHKAGAAGAAGAVATLVIWLVARLTGALEAPSESTLIEAIGLLAGCGATGLTAAVAAYLKRNHLKALAILIVGPLLLLLPACEGSSLVGKFQEYRALGEDKLAPAMSEVVIFRCGSLSLQERTRLAEKINAANAAKGSAARVSALDCDGDSEPDFVLPGS